MWCLLSCQKWAPRLSKEVCEYVPLITLNLPCTCIVHVYSICVSVGIEYLLIRKTDVHVCTAMLYIVILHLSQVCSLEKGRQEGGKRGKEREIEDEEGEERRERESGGRREREKR